METFFNFKFQIQKQQKKLQRIVIIKKKAYRRPRPNGKDDRTESGLTQVVS